MVKQGTVLVVDDNKGILKALGLLLDKYFDKVILISSPNRIAGTLWNERVDVVRWMLVCEFHFPALKLKLPPWRHSLLKS